MVSYACHAQILLVEMIGWLHSQRQYYIHPWMNLSNKHVFSFVLRCIEKSSKKGILTQPACSVFSTWHTVNPKQISMGTVENGENRVISELYLVYNVHRPVSSSTCVWQTGFKLQQHNKQNRNEEKKKSNTEKRRWTHCSRTKAGCKTYWFCDSGRLWLFRVCTFHMVENKLEATSAVCV